ncbi:4'-phosphopantetheinyl transferase family protein [Streptomyces sp. NPDC059396]|uniref:4'-phosphopantetheinyl transferase family protein n=1 Tax=Streptomyces sp. NPDC059396 TaxID=3346819 RepID=UPI00368CF893
MSREAQSRTGRSLLRWVLAAEHGMTGPVGVERDAFGKPFVAGMPWFHFSLSHSGDLVALAVDVLPVGVDIQRIGAANPDVGKRYFHPEEWASVAERAGADRTYRFHALWALKESYTKHTGQGLRTRLDSFVVQDGKSGDSRESGEGSDFTARTARGEPLPVRLLLRRQGASHVLAVCTDAAAPREDPLWVPHEVPGGALTPPESQEPQGP